MRLARLPRGQGRSFPVWLSVQDPEALRGTLALRTVDPNLTVGLDVRRGVYQVWGPSLDVGGWTPICDCQSDDGIPFRGSVPWPLIVRGLIQAREGELGPDRAARENAGLEAAAARVFESRLEEGSRYAARAVNGEVEGWGRCDGRDLDDAFRCADEGRSKVEPRGRVHFAMPGVVAPGAGAGESNHDG